MDDLLAPLQDIFEAQIDFHGQKVTDYLSTGLLSIFSVIAFTAGFIYQDVHITLWIGLAGTALTMLIVVPAWPAYNKHPEPWLVPGAGTSSITIGGAKVR